MYFNERKTEKEKWFILAKRSDVNVFYSTNRQRMIKNMTGTNI